MNKLHRTLDAKERIAVKRYYKGRGKSTKYKTGTSYEEVTDPKRPWQKKYKKIVGVLITPEKAKPKKDE